MSDNEQTTLKDFFGMLADVGTDVKEKTTDNPTEPSHYKELAIDPLEYMSVNFSNEAYMGFLEGNVIKYVSRYKMKNGVEDLRKAQHYLVLLIDRQEMRENQNK